MGAACQGSRAISAFIFCTSKHNSFFLLSLIFYGCWLIKRKFHKKFKVAVKARSNSHGRGQFQLSRTCEHELSFSIIYYHQLSCSLDMFKFDMIVHDSFFRLTERMIVHDSFSVSGGNQGGLNAIWLPHCHRPVKNNKAIIWTNIRTTVTLKARK